MIRLTGTVLALIAAAVPVDVAVAGDTRMVVPSRSTATELDSLSRSNVVAEVLTVDRNQYVLTLDGSGGGAFSGEGVSGESADPAALSAIRIPLEHLALVYYVEVPRDKKNDTFRSLVWEGYPSIAAIGAAERTMDCSELDTEIARAGTIRWYARRHGVVPFTEHEARVQHGKNTGKYAAKAAEDVGMGLAVVLALAVGANGRFPFPSTTPSPIDQETFRWALTAADRREVGLLRLKRERLCPASATLRAENTDLEILTKIDATRQALATRSISDQEQMRQQTQLLDQFDPEDSGRIVATSELEASYYAMRADEYAKRADEYDKRADEQAGAVVAFYDGFLMKEPKSTDCSYSDTATQREGRPFQIRERALMWLNSSSQELESLRFEEIQEVRPLERHSLNWSIPIRKSNGSCAFLSTLSNGSRMKKEMLEAVRSKIIDCIAQHCGKISAPAAHPTP